PAGVVIFDNGVKRPKTSPDNLDASNLLAFASPSILYGNSILDRLSKLSIDSSGVAAITDIAPFFAGHSMILANNLLYVSSGQVIDPTTGNLVGTFTGGGFFNTSHVIDVVTNRPFFLG